MKRLSHGEGAEKQHTTPIKRPLTTPNTKNALSLLPKETQEAILSDNRKKQVFQNIVFKLTSGGKPVPERKLRVISHIAANRVLSSDSISLHLKKPSWIERIKGQRLLKEFTMKKFVEQVGQNHSVVFESGARTTISLLPGDPIHEFRLAGRAMRVIVKPHRSKKETPEEKRSFDQLSKIDFNRDIHTFVSNSIGYLGAVYAEEGVERAPVIAVLLRQERLLPSFPPALRKRYKDWDIEALRVVEKAARQFGIKKMVVISPEHYEEMGMRRAIIKQYTQFAKTLGKNGYTPEHLKLLGAINTYGGPAYFVKHL